MLEENFKVVLSEELELIVDKNIVLEAMVISGNVGYCYPFPKDYELYLKLNEILEKVWNKEFPHNEPYIVVYNIASGGSIVGFKLPSGSNIFLKLRYAEHSDIARKEILELIKKLRQVQNLLDTLGGVKMHGA